MTQTSKISSCTFLSSSPIAVCIMSIKKGCLIRQLHTSRITQNLERKKKTRREGVLLNWCKSSVSYATYLNRRWSRFIFRMNRSFLCCQISVTDCTLSQTNTLFSIPASPASCFSCSVLGLLKSSSSVHRCDSVIESGSFSLAFCFVDAFSLALSIFLTVKGFWWKIWQC